MTRFPLGRVRQHDPRSLAYPAPAFLTPANRWWRRYGAVLDQGNLGSCTGNAGCHALNHAPYHQVGTTTNKETDAISLYSAATSVDPFPGIYPPEDTGSSGLAIAQVLLAWGKISSYVHAFGFDHALSAAMSGPLLIGSDWYDGMFTPDPTGLVRPTGSVAGGHEYVLSGVNVTRRLVRFQNSWGPGWGDYGKFYMSFENFASLLADGGDAILLTR